MSVVRAAGDSAQCADRLPLGIAIDSACLAAFSVAGPLLAVVGGGPLRLPTNLDAGTVLAVLACLGPALSTRELAGRDRTILVLAALTWIALDGRIIAAGLTAAGLVGLRPTSRIPACLSALWLAIAVHVLWAPLVFRFIGRWLIEAEMMLIGAAAQVLVPNVQVVGARIQTESGWYVYVLEGCSAFAGMSTAALVWLATIRLLGSDLTKRATLGLILGLIGVVAVNVARILLMLPSAEAYEYWHLGTGSTVIVTAWVLLGAAPAIIADKRR